MPELKPDVSDSHLPDPDRVPDPSPVRSAGSSTNKTDPFDSLFKMSTTAGLGSADYVAINGTSIAAVLLGITSALVLFGSLLLLLIPVAGIICAILAFRQIRSSNGTQTGRGLAAVGLLLSLGLGGFYVTNGALTTIHNRSDEQHVIALIEQFGDFIHAEKYNAAYQLCDDRFTGRVSEAQFAEKWKAANSNPIYGSIQKMDWNQLLKFDDDPVTGERICSGMVLLSFAKVPGQERMGMAFRLLDGKWWVDDLPSLFPQDQAPSPGGRPPAAPANPAGPPAPKP